MLRHRGGATRQTCNVLPRHTTNKSRKVDGASGANFLDEIAFFHNSVEEWDGTIKIVVGWEWNEKCLMDNPGYYTLRAAAYAYFDHSNELYNA